MADKFLKSILGSIQPGSAPATLIVNAFSDSPFSVVANINTKALNDVSAKQILSGATTAGVLKELLSIANGAGVLEWVAIWSNNATSRTLRIEITLDGNVVFDSTSNSVSSAGNGAVIIGSGASSTASGGLGNVPFSESCSIKVASSLTESDGIVLGLRYRLVQT